MVRAIARRGLGDFVHMSDPVRIAIDAMGGDFGPEVIVPGAALALAKRPQARFLLCGDQAKISPELDKLPQLKAASEVIHTEVAVKMSDKPSVALRAGRRNSSMWLALDAVRRGAADVAVSAGNTGALMAMAKICLHMMPQVERPAIAARWPTQRGESIVLDLGASIGADAHHLVSLAIMGAAMTRIVLGIERPSIGLLNIGVEEVKGLEEVRTAARLLREYESPTWHYLGFVEGDDIGKGTVDVVVTEGFTGNIALKAAEGTARQISRYLREAMSRDWRSKLGYLLAKPAFEALRDKMDPRRSNGGLFLGLEGLVIKSHGGTDSQGFAEALDVGYTSAQSGLIDKIREELARMVDPTPQTAAIAANS